MQDNNYTGPRIIIDDDGDFDCEYLGVNLLKNHLKTNCHGEFSGLQKEHILRAGKTLGK